MTMLKISGVVIGQDRERYATDLAVSFEAAGIDAPQITWVNGRTKDGRSLVTIGPTDNPAQHDAVAKAVRAAWSGFVICENVGA